MNPRRGLTPGSVLFLLLTVLVIVGLFIVLPRMVK